MGRCEVTSEWILRGVDSVNVAEDRDKGRAVVSAVMNHRVV
jgi:hypothetical protein